MKIRKNRWPVALEGIIANLLLGALFTWSVFRHPLLELFPTWSEGMLSTIFGVHNIFVCLGILLVGKLSEHYARRKLFLVFALMELVGLGGFALLPVSHPAVSFVIAICLFAVCAAVGIGLGINIVQSVTLAWFPDRTGMMSGALYMALGVSSIFLAAVVEKLLPLYGVKLSMALLGLIIFIVSLLILGNPCALSMPVQTPQRGFNMDAGLTPKQMLRSLPFWLLFFWNVCLRGAGLILLDHAANIAMAFSATALVGMLISPANGLGSFSFGALLDRIGLRRNMVILCIVMLISSILLLIGGRLNVPSAVVLGLVCGGISYGGSSGMYAAAIKILYGQKHFSANLGISNIAMGAAALLDTLSGYILDARQGDYLSIFCMVGVLAVPSLLCCLLFRRPRKAMEPL
jgi:OFA family oxalate/formate antiporter-like MFS transporter